MELPSGIFSKTPFTVSDILSKLKEENIEIKKEEIIKILNNYIKDNSYFKYYDSKTNDYYYEFVITGEFV